MLRTVVLEYAADFFHFGNHSHIAHEQNDAQDPFHQIQQQIIFRNGSGKVDDDRGQNDENTHSERDGKHHRHI